MVTLQYAIPSLIALVFAQILKCVFDSLINRKISIRMLMNSGGIPSSHSAICTALATYVGLTDGFQSPLFGFAFVLSTIVMYDAIGVRQETGKQSRILNEILEIFEKHGRPLSFTERLNTLTGHTLAQVVAGAFFGVGVGVCYVVAVMLLNGDSLSTVLVYILHRCLPAHW
jgi:acid phosphatase family membrane protein YuiD